MSALLMWPGELTNSECSPGCSSRQPEARIYEHTGPQFNRLGGQSAASSFRWSIPTLGFFIQIVGELAKFIGNLRCA